MDSQEMNKFISGENISKMKTSAVEKVSQEMDKIHKKTVKSEEKAKNAYLFIYF